MAVEAKLLPDALRAVGVHVTANQIGEALTRYSFDRRRSPLRIELAEWFTLIEQLRPLDEVWRIFSTVDRDCSGDIDAAELHVALHMLGLDASTGQSRQLLERCHAPPRQYCPGIMPMFTLHPQTPSHKDLG